MLLTRVPRYINKLAEHIDIVIKRNDAVKGSIGMQIAESHDFCHDECVTEQGPGSMSILCTSYY